VEAAAKRLVASAAPALRPSAANYSMSA
jgi:hypothetical protein